MATKEPSGKSAAIMAYILIVGVLIALSINTGEDRSKFASFHIRQALGLSIVFVSLGLIVSNFDNWMITASMYIFVGVLWSFGLFSAAAGRMTPVPLLGAFFQKFFKNL
ncbi:MAG TPA: hypothetical protein VK183_04685 [Flavobacterium sp.]|nr:hypothetical protein [Flavobacterium sp.]